MDEAGRASLVTVDHASDPDLFWGLRGAAPLLAIVTGAWPLLPGNTCHAASSCL